MIAPAQTRPVWPRNPKPARAVAVRVVALLLGCLTVVTLVAAAALTRVPASSDAPTPATARAAVARFVEAANAAVATGDAAAFDGVLAEDFRLHAEATGIGSDRAALARYLVGVRITYPDASFVSDDVMADGHLALLRFELHGGGSGVVAGVPVGRPSIPGDGVAVLRVAGRRVAEVWGFVSLPAVEPVTAATVTALTSGSVVGAARMTYAPGAGEPSRVLPGPVIVSIERGTLRAAINGPAGVVRAGRNEPETFAPAAPGGAIELRPGETLIVPAFTWHALRNDGTVPAVAFVVAVLPAAVATWEPSYPSNAVIGPMTTLWPASPAHGVTVERIAGGNAPGLPAGELRVALARVSLAPNMGLALLPDTWAAIVSSEAGALRLEADKSESQLLLPGEGALIAPNDPEASAVPPSAVNVRNDGADASTLLLIAIVPADA